MLFSIAWTALVMGLVGGPHCLAMCAAPCSAVVGGHRGIHRSGGFVLYHLGRLIGYASAGALAAWAMQSLAWLTTQTVALRPVWTLMHLGVLVWGITMLVQARQPAWVETAGRSVWRRVQPVVVAPGGILAAGFLWALMPCGLLYSALLVAALSGGPLQGAMTMTLFALGSGAWLVIGPWAWLHLRNRINGNYPNRGTRMAGFLLCGVAVWALWLDAVHGPELWCQ